MKVKGSALKPCEKILKLLVCLTNSELFVANVININPVLLKTHYDDVLAGSESLEMR